jgi:hypothetical protein
MTGVTIRTATGGPSFLLRSALPTAPDEAIFAFGPGLDAHGSSGARERRHPAHAGPAEAG